MTGTHLDGWTEQVVLQRIEAAIRRHGSLRAAAQKLGVSAAFLCDVNHGHREAGPKLLKALGLRKQVKTTRVVRYFDTVALPRRQRPSVGGGDND